MYRETIIIIVFLAGLLFCINRKKGNLKEGFIAAPNCPNLLIQKGTEIHLYNNNRARIPGVNPIKFNNLDEYVEFMKWQRRMGIRCPVLYFQETYDAQNNLGFRMLDNPVLPNGGMLTGLQPLPQRGDTLLYDANRLDPPYNQGDFPAYDPMDQYIGDYTPLDRMFHQAGPSNNPMDADYVPTNSLDQGHFLQRRRTALNPPTPLKQTSQNQYVSANPQYNSPPSNNAAQYTQQMADNLQSDPTGQQSMSQYIQSIETSQENNRGQNTTYTPQTSSMAQYVDPQTNPPNTIVENTT
jgi:hypothetical protein